MNSTNSVSAGLAISAAVTFFVAPPVAAGLAIGSAVSGGAAAVGDALADSVRVEEARRLCCQADMSNFALAELLQEWQLSRDHAVQALKAAGNAKHGPEVLKKYGLKSVSMSMAIGSTVASIEASVLAAETSATMAASTASRIAPVAARTLGVVGAVVSTGVAVHGWTTKKGLQNLVRQKCDALKSSVLDSQRWLAGMDELECSVCLEGISLEDDVACCGQSWHYFHRHCMRAWTEECGSRGRQVLCPLCQGHVTGDCGKLEDMINNEVQSLLDKTAV